MVFRVGRAVDPVYVATIRWRSAGTGQTSSGPLGTITTPFLSESRFNRQAVDQIGLFSV